jgi:ribonucleotide monophosphatase NagD (HAD superfamily)
MKTVLLRTGKFRPDDLDYSSVIPDVVLSSIAQFPDWVERGLW